MNSVFRSCSVCFVVEKHVATEDTEQNRNIQTKPPLFGHAEGVSQNDLLEKLSDFSKTKILQLGDLLY